MRDHAHTVRTPSGQKNKAVEFMNIYYPTYDEKNLSKFRTCQSRLWYMVRMIYATLHVWQIKGLRLHKIQNGKCQL